MTNKNATYTSVNNPISFTYNDIIQQQVSLFPMDSNIDVNAQVKITIDTVYYPLHFVYYNNSNYVVDYPSSNLELYLPTSNVLSSLNLPDITATKAYIRKQPTYGNFTIPESISNINTITYRSYHPYKDDDAELLIQYQQGGRPYYKILYLRFIRNKTDYYAIDAYKLHETPYFTDSKQNENIYTLLSSNIELKQLNTAYNESYSASVSGGSLPNKVSYSKQYTCNISYYNCNIGYVYQSNISLIDSYQYVSYTNLNTSDRNKLPARIPWDGITCNIYYYQYTGELPNIIPNNGSYNLQTVSSNIITYSSFYFYGQIEPYYEYDVLNIGSENIYWRYVKQVRRNENYQLACNITVLSCNENYNYQNIISIEDNAYLFLSNVPILTNYPQTSNYILIPSTDIPQYSVTTSNYKFIYQTSNYIPTIKLKQQNLYQKNGTYQVNHINPYDNFIYKGLGLVSIWHQSNIESGSIYYWLSSNLPNNKVYELHKIYFTDGKKWNINYYNNYDLSSSLDQSFRFYTSNFISQELTGGEASPPYNFRYQNNTFMALQSFSNSIIINKDTYEITNKIDFTDVLQRYYYIPLSKIQSEDIETFYIQTSSPINKARTLIRKPVDIYQRIIKDIDINNTITDKLNYLTSNHLFTYYNDLNPKQIIYNITSFSNDINKTTFTQDDINNNEIYIQASNLGTHGIDYVLIDNTLQQVFSTGTINVNKYRNTIYPASKISINTCNVLVHLQNTYEHHLEGILWNEIEKQFTSNSYLNSNDLWIHITKNPSKGYLYSSNLAVELGCNIITKINYNNFKTHKLHYIPYKPLELSNDSYQFYFDYYGDISKVYEATIKNYWSQFSPLLIDDTRVINNDYQFTTNRIPYSEGLKQDGYQLNYTEGLLSIAGYNVNYITESKKFTERPYFKIDTLNKIIDLADYVNFKDLISPFIIVSSNSRDLHYFITSNPSKGCILKYDNSKATYLADTYFTYTDVLNNTVFYHHYGEDLENDKFEIMVGSLKASGGGDYNDDSVMDVNSNSLTYNIQIQEKTKVLRLNEEYIYKQTSNAILNDYNLVSSSVLKINRGNINVISTSNIDFYVDNGTTCNYALSFSASNIDNNKVYYRINSNIYKNSSNINEPMILNFTISSQSNIDTEINPLSQLSYYKGLYLQEWKVNLNNYESSNILLKSLNSNQVIQYYQRRVSSDFISFDNRRLQIDFTLYPEQQVLYNDTLISSFNHTSYLQQLKTFSFDFKILDDENESLVFANFTHSNIRLVNSNNQHIINIPVNIPFNVNNIISFILNDERNNSDLSMFINNINYLENINFRPNIPPNKSIRSFILQANIDDPFNYYNYVLTSNISQNVYLYYNLINFTNRLKFNDFNILVNTNDITFRESYTNDTYTFTSNLHNVIIGKILDVKGVNNICIGKNFKTIGSDSIILGNNIGINLNDTSGGNTLNEIFQSIVIANNSFINSKVRDVIAIGNNIFGTDPPQGADINGFLQKKPVLVGNDISVDLIDFHINFQNTVLKTTYNTYQPGGIYLGLNKEIVAIGYEANQSFSNEYQLYVNGGISYKGNITSLGELNSVKQVFGNIVYTSGTEHTLRIRVEWENVQTDDYAAFTVSGKFRGILNDSSHVYRRFETWVTPRNDISTSKPKALTDFEIASYSSVGINNYEHDIIRDGIKSVIVHIEWQTLLELASMDKMVVHLDLEISYPNTLGKIIMTKI
jgi:hypothetical protein